MVKINIVRGAKDQEPVTKQISFREARKAVNGDLLIFDHDLIRSLSNRWNINEITAVMRYLFF